MGARVSPDAHTVAFSSEVDNILQVFVILTSGGEPLQLTKDSGDKVVDSFSSDGTEIYYSRAMGRDEEWAVPTLGGESHKLLSGSRVVPSLDGSALYYMKSRNTSVFQADHSGFNEQVLVSLKDLIPAQVLPFPDGKRILIFAAMSGSTDGNVFIVDLQTKAQQKVGVISGTPDRPVWFEPGKSVVMARAVDDLTNLWKYDLENRSFTQITNGPGPDRNPMVDAARGIYYVSGKDSGMLMTYSAKTGTTQQIQEGVISQPVISWDGNRVMYILFQPHGNDELWVSNLDGSNKKRLASMRGLNTGDWSPDGTMLGFEQNPGGKGFVARTDGGAVTELGKAGDQVINIAFSPIEKRVYISGIQSNKQGLWQAKPDGSPAEKIVEGCILNDVTPDGKYLLGNVDRGDRVGIYQVSLADGKLELLLPGIVTFSAHIAPDGKAILYAVEQDNGITIYRTPWKDGKLTGEPEVALKTPFAFRLRYRGNAYDFSRDLSSIVFAKSSAQTDLYLLGYSK